MSAQEVDANNVITRTNLGVVASTADEMDERRRNTMVVDYLRKLDEAKQWIEGELGLSMALTEFVSGLPKGKWLAEIAKRFDGGIVREVCENERHEFLYTENINMFLEWCVRVRLSRHFYFEVIDLYESKNIPKVIYCIHGLACFLKSRGMSGGISRGRSEFSAAEKALVDGDVEQIAGHCYDDIEEKVKGGLNDEGTEWKTTKTGIDTGVDCGIETGINANTEESTEPRTKCYDQSQSAVLRSFSRTFMDRGLYRNITGLDRVSVASIRRFVGYDSRIEEEERMLVESSQAIFERFKTNSAMQEKKEALLRSVRLLLENQSRLRGIEYDECLQVNDYRLFKRVVYSLIHDYELVYQILRAGYELPLSMFYPDHRIGDYHFAKFIEHVIERHGEDEAMEMASRHFTASRVFKNLTQMFARDRSGLACRFVLNPVDVYAAVHGPEADGTPRRVLREEALADPLVVEEIIVRSRFIAGFMNERLDYIARISLPYYVRLFAHRPGFFEAFIERAVLLSDSFMAAELLKCVFYSQRLFVGEARSGNDGSLVYYECQATKGTGNAEKNTNFDLTDYSPLREWLESERHSTFYSDFVARNSPSQPANVAVFDEAVADECVEIETCLDEINALIVLLKENISLMGDVIASLVSKLTLIRQQPSDVVRVAIDHPSADIDHKACERVGSDHSAAQKPLFSSAVVTLEQINKHSVNYAPTRCSHVSKTNPMKERFILKLDTQFINLESDAQFAIAGILNSLKCRIILLISLSTASTLSDVLKTTTEAEAARFAHYSYISEGIAAFKQSVIDDIDFLASKNIISHTDSHQAILNMIAYDSAKSWSASFSALSLNQDTLDALHKKGIFLRKDLDFLYRYFAALIATMVTNKSGFFNRQALPNSRYGSYSYSLQILQPVMFEDINISSLSFVISMEEPLVFTLTIKLNHALWDTVPNIRFDELLRLREDKVACFDAFGVMSFNVNSLINIINRQYVKF